ncbi:RluA family pseudouridine synthase [Acidiluteibacter ferrifornacis]|uniref:Pseudouridine synthase n=1 Tax=Acidiluteibacter ferrifornacis TaxID=2692424 RepID=A0A6N9NMB4_9FLAO|nr:RluA family pseudouridine synthase [Acidiluteibacter ferrifornacis]MBR9831214.1 RluA family pseudouridine synthase [bacterium]NBG67034.1 RluA family pseudouridine synthase [Acidiluteibacter ferrifornacis]
MIEEEEYNEELEQDSDELFEHYKYIADKGQTVLRIDKFLNDRLPNTSRNKIQDAANAGNVVVNGVAVKSNYKVKPLDEISIVLPYPPRVIELIPENIPLDILYEDDTLLVLNKASNMVVHPGYGNYSGTLVNALIYHINNLPEADGNEGRPGLVHRLDKNTTGIMVIAKTEQALTHLSKQFYDRTSSRTYQALVWGDMKEDSGRIEGHIGRSLKNRKLMDIFPDGEFGKAAITNFRVLERFGYVTLVEYKLETGRTHQIRAHSRFIGHPLFNDPEYGGDRILKGTTFTKYKQFINNCFEILPRQALHAKTLGFTHPKTGEWMEFNSELPDDMTQVIARWKNYIVNRSLNEEEEDTSGKELE